MSSPPARLFFMHIPKTAGTSFRRLLERSVREAGGRVSSRVRDGIWSEQSESYASYDEFVASRGSLAADCDLVCGHYPYHVAALLPGGFTVVTVLRDPITRCLSHIKHQMALERVSRPEGVEPDVNAFVEAPRNEMFLRTIGNLSVKYLGARVHPDALVDVEDLSVYDAVDAACRIQFGFVEEIEDFRRRLVADGLLAPVEVPAFRENRSEDPFGVDELTAPNRARLRALNALDIRLDDLLRELLEARVTHHIARIIGAGHGGCAAEPAIGVVPPG
jgi:hypothetical protein